LLTFCADDIFFQGILASFNEMLDDAFKVLEERCMRRWEGFQYYWHVIAACGLVQSRLGNESFEDVRVNAIDRIAKFYHRVLAFQEGPEIPPTIPPFTAIPRVQGGQTAPNSWYYSANVLGVSELGAEWASDFPVCQIFNAL
jgi:hypothetical protein